MTADSARRVARHGVQLSPDEIVAAGAGLLEPTGRLSLIFPAGLADRVLQTANSVGLDLYRQTDVHTRPDLLPKRRLMEFGFVNIGSPKSDSLVIENSKHVYGDAWRALTGEFYL